MDPDIFGKDTLLWDKLIIIGDGKIKTMAEIWIACWDQFQILKDYSSNSSLSVKYTKNRNSIGLHRIALSLWNIN